MSATQYQLLVRNAADDLFVASVLGMSDLVAEGRTREEAIAQAKKALERALADGEIVTIEIEDVADTPTERLRNNVWNEEADRLRGDPTFDEFLSEIRVNRDRSDSE